MDIKEVVEEYGKNKDVLSHYDALCKDGNKKIKKYLSDAGTKKLDSDNYTVTLSIRETSTMNEDKLIEIAHSTSGLENIIKTKEYIDYDALESLIYQGKLSKDVLLSISQCRSTKQIEVLNISRKGDKKDV